MVAVDNLLNETELEIVIYTGQLDLIVDTLGRSARVALLLLVRLE